MIHNTLGAHSLSLESWHNGEWTMSLESRAIASEFLGTVWMLQNYGRLLQSIIVLLANECFEQSISGYKSHLHTTYSRGVMHSTASSYAAMHMVAGSRPVFVIAWEWHIGLALLCGCSGALEYPTTNSYRPINKSLSLSLSLTITHNLPLWHNA